MNGMLIHRLGVAAADGETVLCVIYLISRLGSTRPLALGRLFIVRIAII